MWVENNRLYDRYVGRDGKTHKASVPLAKNTPQAHRMARNALENKIAGILSPECKTGLNALVRVYLNSKNVKTSTMINYENAFGQIVSILGDDLTAAELSAPLIRQKFLECEKPISKINRYTLLLNNFLRWLYEYGYISAPIKISTLKEKKQLRPASDLFLEQGELRKLLERLAGTMDGYICEFMALTGCRIGEAAALTLADVGDRYISITKTYFEKTNSCGPPKTATSERDIFIQPELRKFLRNYFEWRSLYMLARGIRTDKLFFSCHGDYLHPSALRGKLSRIDAKLHPHIFRHTHVALLAERGASLETISRRLGHSDSKITRDVYFHVTERMKEQDESFLETVSFL